MSEHVLDRRWRSLARGATTVRRTLHAQAVRLREPERAASLALIVVVGGVTAAGLIARGDAAGADARAYWAAVRIWLNGGSPYHPEGPFLPYVYPPWMLPFFAPWALLPWDVAWFVWRGAQVILLGWTLDWAYRRRPLRTALFFLLLAFPIAVNLDTGNVTLLLALMLWGAQFSGPRAAGLLWAIATWMKWIPAPLFLVLAPRARLWGIGFLAVSALLSLLTLPLTITQFQALFGFGPRPIRLDYLVLLWAAVPWLWTHPRPLWWVAPSAWPRILADWRNAHVDVARDLRTGLLRWGRAFLGLGG